MTTQEMVQELEKKRLNELVDQFSTPFMERVKARLSTKADQGWLGWDNEVVCTNNDLKIRALDNLMRGDFVDVAALASFLWYRQRKVEEGQDAD